MKVLGIDPGIQSMGWALAEWDGESFVFEKFVVFVSKKEAKVGVVDDCLDLEVYVESDDFYRNIEVAGAKVNPDVMIIEHPIFKGYPTEVLVNIGWVSHLFWSKGAQILFVNPSTWKKEVVGKGNADKKMVRERTRDFYVRRRDGVIEKVDGLIKGKDAEHIFDAMCIAFYVTLISEGGDEER